MLAYEDSVSDFRPRLRLPAVREPLLAKEGTQVIDVPAEDGVQ